MSVLNLEEVKSIYPEKTTAAARPVTFWTIALAVLVGNFLTAVAGAIVYVAATH
jgi:hypothetical protein